ncbi:hypothetical protein P152DRAFT_406849 [Eremomyces bilateralis CBS 781.70]|uniref:Formin binding protein n=1 Tax=Eremomyces bilateralis CBS 781.70 TaxID=1392243 RepID=A0A6G1GFL9_9PEZI|nr:uncharacterized protein P152DRAFT_406849 [Eremomyces bilateralis CBS 781.70]KAF1816792.1 hypothetical protein P152DRAFT_406849 [Eremomyces bilateralis CBS 781.70]
MNGLPPRPGLWQEAKSPDGRVYFYNTQTKATQWTKPEDLMTPAERALQSQPWKEYSSEGGKKYWYNTESKQSTWEMPEVYKNALAQSQDQLPQRPPPPAFVAGGMAAYSPAPTRDRDPRDRDHRDRDDSYQQDRPGPDRYSSYNEPHRSSFAPSSDEPYYGTPDEAESAFFKLLRRSGVQPDWTWTQMVRACAKDPQYRAIKDPKDRKVAFEKFVTEVRTQEKEREKERQAKVRADFINMLKSHPEIKYYTRWKSIRPIIEGETAFRAAKSEDERTALFNEYRDELWKSHSIEEETLRKTGLNQLTEMLKVMVVDPYTRWLEAHNKLQENHRFKSEPALGALNTLDVMKSFENHIKSLERNHNEARQKEKQKKYRTERQNRDKFIALLNELKRAGKIKAGKSWSSIHPLVEKDPRFDAILGQSGSGPLELFWDIVEEEERLYRARRNDVLDLLDDRQFEITQKTTLAEFTHLLSADRRTASIDPDIASLIFNRLRDKVVKRAEDNKFTAERQQRKAVDALRSRIKRLADPPVTATDTWDLVRPRLEKSDEFRALDSDELRKSAFEKVVRRLKERDEDHEKEKERSKRDKDHRRDDRDRDRGDRDRGDRYRGERNGYPSRRHRTRSPDHDPYEADRRKAQADRERQYRKSSAGVSPPPPPRSTRDRDDRGRRVSGGGHYDRERREREAERERLYVNRGDPRERSSELDYGDSRSGSVRRRRESDAESLGSRREVKVSGIPGFFFPRVSREGGLTCWK